jgi:dTDP-4-dehydrorhamnose 3,5-epimerase
MTATPTAIREVMLITPAVSTDDRGCFFESFNQQAFARAIGRETRFVQDNHSVSIANVVRGLHYQVGRPQGKLVRAVSGEIFDVAVDLRRSSPTFGQWVGTVLSAANRVQKWIPEGFAHGFSVLSDEADVLYKTTDFYAADCERAILWNDPSLSIDWRLTGPARLSAKDERAQPFASSEYFD